MEELLPINIRIAGRTYPLSVRPEDEETAREAGRLVNERFLEEKNKKKKRDDQDILAVVAVMNTVRWLEARHERTALQDKIAQRISRLDELIDSTLTT
ncbi:cell division protein ZapA [Larkinella insperata]|uniref:Cell division protein ZapA n=1 Tax=Larkinella insperata TaxID=332158 RepID=A0ABW3QDE5_9BACT|nr:cell division protein ZapA [Larkinella insperata]